jgi:benzoyl-CoA reductase subunit C
MHTRQIFQAWQNVTPDAFTYELEVPVLIDNPDARQYLIEAIYDLKTALEKWVGKDISDSDIDRAIDIYNTNRQLMLSIYELMKADYPPLTGVELLQMALSGMFIDKEDHNRLLKQALNELVSIEGMKKRGPRLMLLGSVNNDFGLIEMIENCGARIVIDDYCTGNRYYQSQIVPMEDRLSALSNRLIEKPPCPLKDLSMDRRRVTHISKLIDEYRVEGIVYTIQKQCDSHGLDYPAVQAMVETKGIPMLKLELDFSSAIEQYRTRLEAFIEMLEVS